MIGGGRSRRRSAGETAAANAASEEDARQVEAIVRRSGTSFFWSMRLMPLEKRRAMFAVYAFCREVDDIADEPAPLDDKRRGLRAWREEIRRLYLGEPRWPVSRALVSPVKRFGLDARDFNAMIDGMEMDAAERVRLQDQEQLLVYCDRVAGAVGRLSNRIFGVGPSERERLADTLGRALQLTNILRDIREDAERDRLYLPLDLLRRHGLSVDGHAQAILDQPGIADACSDIADLAHASFHSARIILAACDRRSVRPAVMMMEVYQRTFSRLAARGWRRWAEPVSLSPATKMWVALRYGLV